ncbi:MAG: ribonuclease HI family protein [Gemmataceae bacterium]|nr:ribonuclease HI family protein [Gemmataceae bacterium]MDW8266124.1 ribonuclease HI family protein [Gemmataceae bacterium]
MSKAGTIYTDGAARGNPGPAAYAFVIHRPESPPIEKADFLGHATNNVAEYTALVKALEYATRLGIRRLLIHSDSELLVRQMNGQYQVKSSDLRPLFERAKQLCRAFDTVSIIHVSRDQNRRADQLCNQILDQRGGAGRPGPAKPTRRKRTALRTGGCPTREKAIDCLRAAAAAWARGNPSNPSPEMVWDQIWSVLEEEGLVRRASVD